MRTIMLVLLWALAAPVQAGEKLSGSHADVRTTLAFKVSDAAVQKLVPAGWALNPPPAGPSKGFNVAVVLVDSFSAFDAEGKPTAPLFDGSEQLISVTSIPSFSRTVFLPE